MKKELRSLFRPLLLAVMCVSFFSCEGNNLEENNVTFSFKSHKEYYLRHSRNSSSYVKITKSGLSVNGENGLIVDVGDKNLSQIRQVPKSGWAETASYYENEDHGYIARWKDTNWDEDYYMKIYIIGGIWCYYCEWNP